MSNENYNQIGTPLTVKDSGGSATATWSSLGNGNGRVAARLDIGGTYPHPRGFRWSLTSQWVATPTANKSLDLYVAAWDDDAGPSIDFGIVGNADAVLTVTKRFNLLYVGSLRVESAAVGPFTTGDKFDFPYRYGSFALYNDGGVALAAVGTYATILTITPIYDQIQP